jgi:hypothetical protein
MANLDDILTTQKNGVVAVNAVAENTFGVQGRKTALEISSATQIYTGTAWVARVSVIVAGSAGAIYDANTIASAIAGQRLCIIPATVGIHEIMMPVTRGIVVSPGAGMIVSVSYT